MMGITLAVAPALLAALPWILGVLGIGTGVASMARSGLEHRRGMKGLELQEKGMKAEKEANLKQLALHSAERKDRLREMRKTRTTRRQDQQQALMLALMSQFMQANMGRGQMDATQIPPNIRPRRSPPLPPGPHGMIQSLL